MGLAGIILSLALLMYFAYRGVNVLILAPILSLLAVLMSGGLPVLATYTQVFMGALAGFLNIYFPIFMLGAIFGRAVIREKSAFSLEMAAMVRSVTGPRNGPK